jgi:DNA-binding HxlR family transcriptional regulator
MTRIDDERDACPIARVTALIGEPWTLLVLREAFLGRTRFGDFERQLGIARNILSDRLRKLVGAGILTKSPDPDDRRAREYRLTPRGRALFPAVIALAQWAGEHLCGPGCELRFVDRTTGAEVAPIQVRTLDGRLVESSDLDLLLAGFRTTATN